MAAIEKHTNLRTPEQKAEALAWLSEGGWDWPTLMHAKTSFSTWTKTLDELKADWKKKRHSTSKPSTLTYWLILRR
jgi:hypothetical protein